MTCADFLDLLKSSRISRALNFELFANYGRWPIVHLQMKICPFQNQYMRLSHFAHFIARMQLHSLLVFIFPKQKQAPEFISRGIFESKVHSKWPAAHAIDFCKSHVDFYKSHVHRLVQLTNLVLGNSVHFTLAIKLQINFVFRFGMASIREITSIISN